MDAPSGSVVEDRWGVAVFGAHDERPADRHSVPAEPELKLPRLHTLLPPGWDGSVPTGQPTSAGTIIVRGSARAGLDAFSGEAR